MPRITRRTVLVLLVVVAASVMTVLSFSSNSTMSQRERSLRTKPFRDQPIKVVKGKVRGKVITLGKKFFEGDDWLDGMAVTVRNTSGRPISRIELELDFIRPTEEIAGFPIAFPPLGSPTTDEQPIMPGESVEISVSTGDFNNIKRLMNISNYSTVDEVEIIVRDIVFTDGSKWSSGRFEGARAQTRASPARQRLRELNKEPTFLQTRFVSSKSLPQFQCGIPTPNDQLFACATYGCDNKQQSVNFTQFGYSKIRRTRTYCRLGTLDYGPATGDTCSDTLVLDKRVACYDTHFACTDAGYYWDYESGYCYESDPAYAPCVPYYCPSPREWNYEFCRCTIDSPIVIDTSGNGFTLTDGAHGVNFDLNGDSVVEHISWTSTASDDGWLALDRNNNGTIDNGKELFGNFTPQPEPPAGSERNGFLALAKYDESANGGNNDSVIDRKDTIFPSLRLWIDTNHNGISESTELHSLPEFGVQNLALGFKRSARTDQYGNQFRYRAKVRDVSETKVGRWAWDVFLVPG